MGKATFIGVIRLRLVNSFTSVLLGGHRPARSGNMNSARIFLSQAMAHNERV